VNASIYVLYVRLALGIREPNTGVLHTLSPDILGATVPDILPIICLIPVITNNQNTKINAFVTVAEKTDNINTPKITIIGA
jgi:hypothetical protein